MQNLSKQIFIPIFDNMKLAENVFCQKCNAAYKTPLLPWIVGGEYEKSKYRLMIVGKPHRGDAVPVSKHASTMDYCIDWLINCSWAYWSYSREIAQQLYGSTGMNQIVMTNVVKCTNTEGKDTTTNEMLDNCIQRNRVIWRVIRETRPLNILFYTHKLCASYLQAIPFQKELIKEERKSVMCGAKTMPWWERVVLTDWGKVKILVTNHPERMDKGDYVKLVTDWVRK